MVAEKRIVSYSDPLSVRPGDEVRFMVSSLDEEPFEARLVRIICGDVSPDGHGYEEVEVASTVDGTYPGRFQPIHQGSYVEVPPHELLQGLDSLRVELCVYPTRLHGDRSLISTSGGGGGFAVELRDGVPVVRIGPAVGPSEGTVGRPDGTTESTVELGADRAVTVRRWTRLIATYDGSDGTLRLTVEPLVTAPGDRATARRWKGETRGRARVASDGPLLLAAHLAAPEGEGGNDAFAGPPVRSQHLDGRLDAVRLGSSPHAEPEVRWDFSLDIGTDRVTDTGPHGLHGRTVQVPARAVPGVGWTGEVHDHRVDPSHYGAIHFHADDLADAGWEVTCTYQVPDDLPSGVHALRTSVGESHDHAVFFVLPGRQAEPAAVAWLAPTITYRAYANTRLMLNPDRVFGNWSEAEIVNDRFLAEHRECGPGLYDHHRDGHGVAYSSHLRPVLNLKPGGGLWVFTADTNVTAWLDRTGVDHDVITDDALHEEGDDLLAPYRVLITGTHPEYWTTVMLDALERWLSNGGRLMVLGANGFYWRTGVHPTAPGVVEVRRAEDGTRAWVAEPGEYYMESTGELGGLWRRLGRPPNRVCGVGFAAQGFTTSGYYRRSSAWHDPRVAFAVAGLSEGELLGDHGTIGGGAAGQEIDRFDESLGSPAHTIVLASSEGHPPDMLQTKEEFFATDMPIRGTAPRADLVFFETPNGGAVFSTGSIAWAGSLATNDYDNDVARLTTNVLHRFADPEPFTVPDDVTGPQGLPST